MADSFHCADCGRLLSVKKELCFSCMLKARRKEKDSDPDGTLESIGEGGR